MKEGFVKIYRKFFDHYFWEEDREYSKAEAWIWLLKEARYKQSKKRKYISGRLIEWERGELPASIRFLKEAWSWGSTTKVRNFLDLLKKEHMIKIKKTQGQNVISICNYSTYNPLEESEKHSKNTVETQREHTGNTAETQNSKKVKKVKKGKKEKKESDSSEPSEALEVAEYLLDAITSHDPDHRYNANPPTLTSKGWETEIDRAIRLDGRTPEQLRLIIEYVFTQDTKVADFWKPNIQSGKKLRKHFDRIKEQIKNERKNDKQYQKQRNIESELDKFG